MLNVNMTFSLYRKIFFSFIMIILLIVTVFSMVVNIRIYMKQVDEVISTINSFTVFTTDYYSIFYIFRRECYIMERIELLSIPSSTFIC